MNNEVLINGHNLTIDQIVEVALDKKIKIKINEKAKDKINKSRKFVEKLVEKKEIVYGLNTGFGNFKDKIISKSQIDELQANLIRSHAVGTGQIFSEPEIRAAILIRANSLASGYSGIRLMAIEKLLEILNNGIYPYVPQKGSVGASGDLVPLSHLVLVLMGEGEVIENGQRVSSGGVLDKHKIKPLKLSFKEGLAFNNGTSFLTAVAVLNVKRAENILNWSDKSLAMNIEALRGTLSAFDERAHQIRAHSGQIKTAQNIIKLCAKSQLVGPGNDYDKIQDSYSIRCSPQVHGAIRDNFEYVKKTVEIEINSVTDNPLIFSEDEEVISAGNFHGEPIAIAMDSLAIAIAELSTIAERRIAKMLDCANNNGLPAFLIPPEQAGLSSGYMVAQYTAASLVAENKVLAHPVSIDSIPTSANQEDHVSFGATASCKCREIIFNVEAVIAIELMCAAQGLDFRKPLEPGEGVKKVYNQIREIVPFLKKDRILYKDLEKIVELVSIY